MPNYQYEITITALSNNQIFCSQNVKSFFLFDKSCSRKERRVVDARLYIGADKVVIFASIIFTHLLISLFLYPLVQDGLVFYVLLKLYPRSEWLSRLFILSSNYWVK